MSDVRKSDWMWLTFAVAVVIAALYFVTGCITVEPGAFKMFPDALPASPDASSPPAVIEPGKGSFLSDPSVASALGAILIVGHRYWYHWRAKRVV